MHSLIRRQRDFQTYPEPLLVLFRTCHARIERDEEAGEVLDRAGHRKPICVGCCRFVEEKIEFRAYS